MYHHQPKGHTWLCTWRIVRGFPATHLDETRWKIDSGLRQGAYYIDRGLGAGLAYSQYAKNALMAQNDHVLRNITGLQHRGSTPRAWLNSLMDNGLTLGLGLIGGRINNRPYYTVWYRIIRRRGQKSPYNWSNFIKIVIYTLILYFIQISDSAWLSKVSEGRNDETDPLGAHFELPNVVEM